MCLISMVGDQYSDRWKDIGIGQTNPYPFKSPAPLDSEEAKLLKEVQECVELLKAARLLAIALGNPNCETEANMVVIRRVCAFVGVDVDEVLRAV